VSARGFNLGITNPGMHGQPARIIRNRSVGNTVMPLRVIAGLPHRATFHEYSPVSLLQLAYWM
jgi:hypothetical protein